MTTNHFLKSAYIFCLGLLLATSYGCEDDNVQPKLDEDDFVGTWHATSAIHTNNEDAGQSFDLVEHGAELRFTVLEGGKVRTWITFGTYSDEWDASFTISDNVMTSLPVESSRGTSVFTFELDGEALTLTNVEDQFDFSLQGEPEVSTTSVSTFERQ